MNTSLIKLYYLRFAVVDHVAIIVEMRIHYTIKSYFC